MSGTARVPITGESNEEQKNKARLLGKSLGNQDMMKGFKKIPWDLINNAKKVWDAYENPPKWAIEELIEKGAEEIAKEAVPIEVWEVEAPDVKARLVWNRKNGKFTIGFKGKGFVFYLTGIWMPKEHKAVNVQEHWEKPK